MKREPPPAVTRADGGLPRHWVWRGVVVVCLLFWVGIIYGIIALLGLT